MSASTPTPRSRRDAGSGAVRRLPSGRYQARLQTDDGSMSMVPAPHTFATKREASGWLAETVTDRKRGVWGVDPRPANAMTAARPGGGRQEAFTTAASVLRLHAALLPARRSESRSRHRPQRRPRVPITAPVGSTSGSTARDPAPSRSAEQPSSSGRPRRPASGQARPRRVG